MKQKTIIVLGIGNLLHSDEGVGVHAVRAMQAEKRQLSNVELLDGGTLGLSLLPYVEAASHLLILDAVDAGQPPGRLVTLEGEQIPLFSGMKMSQHQVTFQEVLGLALVRGKLPEKMYLIGVQPASLDVGTQLSPKVAALLPHMVGRAWQVLAGWNAPV
jgi:hydrogenase maturation protease